MLKNFLKLLSGNAIAQLIQFLGVLVLTNIYQPESFGKLGKIQSISTIVVIVFTLQLQYILPLTKSNKQAEYYFKVLFSLTILTTLLSLFLSLFLPVEYKLAFILSFFLAINSLTTNYLVFKGSFGSLSSFFILRSLLIVALQLILSLIKQNVVDGLIIGAFCGEIFSALFLIYKEKLLSSLRFVTPLKRIKKVILNWKPYSFYGTIQEALSVMVYSLPMIFYVDKFGDNVGGQYSIAYKLIWAPTVLITSSIAQVLTNKFGQDCDFSFVNRKIWFEFKYLLIIPVFFCVVLLLQKLNLPIIQQKWDLVFQLLPYMFINGVFFLFAMPYRVAMRILKQNKLILMMEVVTLILMLLVFYFINVNVIIFTAIMTSIAVLQNLSMYVIYKLNNRLR